MRSSWVTTSTVSTTPPSSASRSPRASTTWAFRGLGKGSLLAADGDLLIVLSDLGTLLLVEADSRRLHGARTIPGHGGQGVDRTGPRQRPALPAGPRRDRCPGDEGAGRQGSFCVCQCRDGTCPRSEGGTAGTSPSPAAPTLTLEEIVARYEAARGGRERWRALRSIEMEGTFTSFSEEAPFTLRRKRPNLYRFDSRMIQKEMILAQDAQGPWWLYPLYGVESPAKMEEPPAVVMTARDAEIEPALFGYQEKGHKVVLAGRGDVNGQETLRLELTRSNGWVETWHLDPRTYLEVAVDSKVFDYSQTAPGDAGAGLLLRLPDRRRPGHPPPDREGVRRPAHRNEGREDPREP